METLFLLVITFWVLGFYKHTDELDRQSIKCILYSEFSSDFIDISFTSKLTLLKQCLSIPFKHNQFYAEFTEGGFYTAYLLVLFPKIVEQMSSKLYWAKFFSVHGIPHPILYVSTCEGVRTIHKKVDPESIYVQKPIRGSLGFNVKKVTGEEALRSPANTIVQQYINSCEPNKIRHFRFVTLFDGTPYRLKYNEVLTKKHSKSEVSSNGASDSNKKIIVCKDFVCDNINHVMLPVYKLMNMLLKVHKSEWPMVFSIGWDLALHCESEDDAKCYVLEGNIMHSTWVYPEEVMDPNVINDYKQRVKAFLKSNDFYI